MSETFSAILNKIGTDPTLHTGNLYALSKMNQESLQLFQKIWPTFPAQRRRDVMQELVEIGEINFEVFFDPVFLLGLADQDAEVRAQAIKGLWENETVNLIEPFIHLLKTDEAIRVRAAAATALGKYIYLKEIEELPIKYGHLIENTLKDTIYLPDEDVEVRRRAVEAIAFSCEAGIDAIIEAAYYDEDEKMQVSAIFAMGRSANADWRERVIEELDNPNTEIRFEAVRACGELEAKEAVPKLATLLEEDDDMQVMEMALWSLGRIGGETARDILALYADGDVEALALAAESAMEELDLFSGTLDLMNIAEDEFEDLIDDLDIWNDINDQSTYLH
jgi:HEAT repeat protein